MAADQLTATVLDVLQRAPAWVRADLASQDPALRCRAEEVATLIAAALAAAEDDPTAPAASFP